MKTNNPVEHPVCPRCIKYHIFVEGIPKAQPRIRKGKYGNFYNPDIADTWKETIQLAFLKNKKPIIEGPVSLMLIFYFQKNINGKLPLPHIYKPDKDNLEKAVMDSLTQIGVWKDDCQVYDSHTIKYWSPIKTGVEIIIEEEVK